MQNLQLSIPEPCHENWQQMTPTDQGRFCNACAKEVIDFSTMTDIQVLNYFTNMTHEKVCGRALPEQLERTISRPANPKKRLFWYWNYIVMFCMFFGKGNSAKAQGGTKPVTEMNPVKNVDIRGDVEVVAGQISQARQHIVEGKVTDEKGEPIPFASIIMKGTKVGVAADANGAFKINASPNSSLSISAANYRTAEILTDNKTEVNVVLEKFNDFALGGVIVVQNYVDGVYQYPSNHNLVAGIVVKDWETSLAIQHAKIVINKNLSNDADSAFTDKNGKYKIKSIQDKDRYHIKIVADGYESNEFTIEATDFKDRKKVWEILLRKEKVEVERSNAIAKVGKETIVRLGQVSVNTVKGGPLYVVDGTIMTNSTDINPDDVEDYSILQGPVASALFGPVGANGAIVITTKKLKVKNLDTVAVTAYRGRTVGQVIRTSSTITTTNVMGSMIKGVSIKITMADTLRIIAAKIAGAIKIYPNPVHRGEQFNIALKLKQAGLYQVQIIDAAGRIVLTKQINANSKDHTEKLLADSRWGSGVYYISIRDEKNYIISKSSFIVQ